MADSDEDDVAHDYESIDDYIPRDRLLLQMVGTDAGTMQRYGELPFRLNNGSNTGNATNVANRASASLPRHTPAPNFQRRQPGVPTSSAPTTPTAVPQPASAKLNRSNTFPEGPPEVKRGLKPPQRPPKRAITIPVRKDPTILSDLSYTLSDYCTTQSMPKMVRVSAGYYGDCERTSISEGEEFVFYLVKTTLSVPAKPMGAIGNSELFYIPINSLLKIAVIDKPSDMKRQYFYPTMEKLYENRKELPGIVCITKEYHIQSLNVTLPTGSLLFLQPKPTRKLFGPQYVVCKTSKNKQFEIPMDYPCGFGTHPADTQLHPGEYLMMVNKFPVDVQLYQGDSEDGDDGSKAASSVGMSLTLDKPVSQKSIIARTDVEGTRKDNPITVEIPFDLPIEVQSIARDDEDMDQIYSEVMNLYENFSPDLVEKSYASSNEVQQKLNKSVHHDYQPMGAPYQLDCPNTDYQPLQEVLRAREAFLKEQESRGAQSSEIDTLKEEKKQLEEEIEQLRQAKQDYTKLVPQPDSRSSDYTRLESIDHLQELKALNVIGVCQLLENMGLSQYVSKFREEQIDGDLLSDLTDGDLSDLLVTSSLHRKRILLIISGQKPIKPYFDNPYCTVVKSE